MPRHQVPVYGARLELTVFGEGPGCDRLAWRSPPSRRVTSDRRPGVPGAMRDRYRHHLSSKPALVPVRIPDGEWRGRFLPGSSLSQCALDRGTGPAVGPLHCATVSRSTVMTPSANAATALNEARWIVRQSEAVRPSPAICRPEASLRERAGESGYSLSYRIQSGRRARVGVACGPAQIEADAQATVQFRRCWREPVEESGLAAHCYPPWMLPARADCR